MTAQQPDYPAVLETQLVHDAQRRVTTILVDALSSFSAPTSTVGEVRDFVGAMLDHTTTAARTPTAGHC